MDATAEVEMQMSKWMALGGMVLFGVMASGCGAEDAGEAMMAADSMGADETADDGGGTDLPPSGQLTAGEWNDLQHWDYWLELLETDTAGFADAQAQWQVRTGDRIAVHVARNGQGVADAKVRLVDDEMNEIWDTRTDIDGNASLFQNVLPGLSEGTTIRVNRDNETIVMPLPDPVDPAEPVLIEMDEPHRSPDVVDVAFVVDTTGSMGDELTYVQSELVDVIGRAATRAEGVDFRVSGAVYRDRGDLYVVRGKNFSDADAIADFLGRQSANGGGDYPEAVEAGLERALAFDWSESARARLLFLVLDAPPHDTRAERVREATQAAAELGVRIIPVSASGIDKPTEYLLRSMAILSGGTYTFLTDDSGIGNDHLEPTVGDFKVELLNDLLLRLIVERSTR
jgi:hypothetical protein